MNRVAEMLRQVAVCAWCSSLLLVTASGAAPEPTGTPVRLRVTWGGGKPAARIGRVEVVGPSGNPVLGDWRLLSADPVAPATMHVGDEGIEIHEPKGLETNGLELQVFDCRESRVRVRLSRRDSADAPVVFEAAVADLLAAPQQRPLDREGNRLSIARSPGDELRIVLAGHDAVVKRPGESLALVVHPLVPSQAAVAAAYDLKVTVRRSDTAAEVHVQSVAVEDSASVTPGMREFRPVKLAVPLPREEGAADIVCELVERGGLRWARPVATRTIQAVVVATETPDSPGSEWKVIHEVDPGSPKLLERLRRLPGMGLPSLPMPSVPLPKLPRPSFTLPKVTLPATLPNVPLPAVPVPKLPAVNTMVPRLTGLLAVGYSKLESHALGPMLRLPPADEGPCWETVALPAGEPGMPHLVEVEYPLEQEMALGLAVLEESDGDVRATATSGIDLRPPVVDDGGRRGRLGTRRFVFWPRTAAPVLVITNLSARHPALFGKVRVLAGPATLAPGEPPRQFARRTYLHIPEPDFTRFGAVRRGDAARGGSATDWNGYLGAARRSADWALAQGASGALVGVYAEGAAVWPTRQTCYAPRWDSGGALPGTLDPVQKDILGLLCRVYARQGLGLVPAVVCNGPMPVLDAAVARGGEAAHGIVVVGRDGAAMTTAGGGVPHYNILDQRVQAAVEDVVLELVRRLRDASCVDGIAILLPHDGWLHLPGVAAGIDDATFARFVAQAGPGVAPLAAPALRPGEAGRFAARAALVEGPLREAWLAWREETVAAFHGRLADVVAATGPRRTLYVMPTTLFVAGLFAERFRPQLAADSGGVDVLREAGVDPVRIAAHGRIVYVAPHAHTAADDLSDRGIVREANRSLPLLRGVAAASRTGVVLVERPQMVDMRDAVAHASFTTKPSAAMAVAAPAGGADAQRALAEALIAADMEVVFDAGLLHACLDEDEERFREAAACLPTPLSAPAGVSAPLVVRTHEGESGLWVSIVNACGSGCQAVLGTTERPTAVVDAVTKAALPVGPDGQIAVPLGPWEVRTVILEGNVRITSVRAVHAPDVVDAVAAVLADLEKRRGVLELPSPLAALDNPGFDLPEVDGVVPGWELVESNRGTLRRVPGKPSAGGDGLAFASENGLATLRSNPFPAPRTGRISVAVWIRAGGPDIQPPLRLAIEGVQDDREFYRFAPVGRGAGAMPLSAAWSQFVLQIDDLPAHGLESLRVRLDLLGPGAVEIDDVRVFDLAFDESQRVRLSKILSVAAERAAAGDIGGCLVELDGPWPLFLRTHVAASGDAVAGTPEGRGRPDSSSPPARSGVVDRVRRWWQ